MFDMQGMRRKEGKVITVGSEWLILIQLNPVLQWVNRMLCKIFDKFHVRLTEKIPELQFLSCGSRWTNKPGRIFVEGQHDFSPVGCDKSRWSRRDMEANRFQKWRPRTWTFLPPKNSTAYIDTVIFILMFGMSLSKNLKF